MTWPQLAVALCARLQFENQALIFGAPLRINDQIVAVQVVHTLRPRVRKEVVFEARKGVYQKRLGRFGRASGRLLVDLLSCIVQSTGMVRQFDGRRFAGGGGLARHASLPDRHPNANVAGRNYHQR